MLRFLKSFSNRLEVCATIYQILICSVSIMVFAGLLASNLNVFSDSPVLLNKILNKVMYVVISFGIYSILQIHKNNIIIDYTFQTLALYLTKKIFLAKINSSNFKFYFFGNFLMHKDDIVLLNQLAKFVPKDKLKLQIKENDHLPLEIYCNDYKMFFSLSQMTFFGMQQMQLIINYGKKNLNPAAEILNKIKEL